MPSNTKTSSKINKLDTVDLPFELFDWRGLIYGNRSAECVTGGIQKIALNRRLEIQITPKVPAINVSNNLIEFVGADGFGFPETPFFWLTDMMTAACQRSPLGVESFCWNRSTTSNFKSSDETSDP